MIYFYDFKLIINSTNDLSNMIFSFRTWLNFRSHGHASCLVSWWAPDEYIRILKVNSRYYNDEVNGESHKDIRQKNHYIHDK